LQYYVTNRFAAPLSSEEQHERETQKNRALASSKQPPPPQALNTRVIGVKQQLSPSASRSQYSTHKRDTYPAPSESFVVLPRPESTQSTNTSSLSSSPHQKRHSAISISDAASSTSVTPYTLQAIHPTSTSTLIEDPNSTRNNTLSHRLKVANRVFELMSSKSSVDHPMCQECLDILLELLNKRLTDVGRERDCYIEFLKKVQDSRVTLEEEKELVRQVEDLKLAEAEAAAELEQLQQEEARLDQELQALDEDMQDLDRQQDMFWEKSNAYQLNLQQFQNERDSINLKYDHDVKQYERLQKTVVYNDAFCISHDGPFGTINGFRLGRLSTHQVDWSEINAAWGQTLLLLYTVASKLKFQFKT
jgi:beclin 1